MKYSNCSFPTQVDCHDAICVKYFYLFYDVFIFVKSFFFKKAFPSIDDFYVQDEFFFLKNSKIIFLYPKQLIPYQSLVHSLSTGLQCLVAKTINWYTSVS